MRNFCEYDIKTKLHDGYIREHVLRSAKRNRTQRTTGLITNKSNSLLCTCKENMRVTMLTQILF